MERGVPNFGRKIERKAGKIKILGISTSYRSEYECAREDPTSLELLKMILNEAKKHGAETELIDLRELKIGPCKECYSTCPAQCRFSEKLNMCDCYPREKPMVFLDDGSAFSLEQTYDKLGKEEFLKRLQDRHVYDGGDDMHVIYRAMREADGIIFAGFTSYYSRPALMQNMFSRLCALDGGVEELWGDGKNLQNSVRYSENPKNKYKQRLYGRHVAFVNVSKEGDSVSPDLMKACTMMGMRIIPFSTCYNVNWYKDPTHRKDRGNALKDKFTLAMARFTGKEIVDEIKKSDRSYGIYNDIV